MWNDQMFCYMQLLTAEHLILKVEFVDMWNIIGIMKVLYIAGYPFATLHSNKVYRDMFGNHGFNCFIYR